MFTIPVALSLMVFFALCAVRRDAGDYQARNEQLALAGVYVRLHDRAGLYRSVRHISDWHVACRLKG